MTVANIHGLYGVSVGSTLLGGITQQSLPTGSEVRGETASGDVYPRIQSMVRQQIRGSFTTRAIAAGLNAVPLTGKKIADLTGGLSFYAQKHAEGGTRETGALHKKYNAVEGMIVLRTLTVDHQGDATLGCEALITYDGTNNPIIVSENVTLPTGLVDDERFSLGPIKINNITFDQVRSFELVFGIDAQTDGADGEIWDRLASIREIKPTITIRGINVGWLKTTGAIPLIGSPGTHANTNFYLRKRQSAGTFVADGTAQHIKLTADGMVYVDPAFDASGAELAETTLIMPLRFDGTNAPVVVDTASAIV